jgi:hypothetical protein
MYLCIEATITCGLLYAGKHELNQDENFDYLAMEIKSRLRAYEGQGPYMAPDGPQTFG